MKKKIVITVLSNIVRGRCVKCLNKLCKVLHNPCETYEPTNSCVKFYTTLVV